MIRTIVWSWCKRRIRVLLLLLSAAFATSAVLLATGAISLPNQSPPNDLSLLALNQGGGQTPAMVPVQHNQEPPLAATPPPTCGAGSHPITGAPDGRVPASAITASPGGYWCNLTMVAHQGQSGGFKVFRYIDPQGHECAYYDTSLLYPTNAISFTGPPSQGVAVLDMSNPAHPVQTATLTSLPMLSPHESLNLNIKRGLLAAVLGNPSTYPGDFAIYSLSQDCRHPVLDSTGVYARFGHESGFSPDGKTFYAAGTAVKAITAIDVSDPKHPYDVWQGNEYSHGMTISDDGNRAYIADPITGELLILDISQIQARKPNPQAFEISRLGWNSSTIPQNAIPFKTNGVPYLLEIDEYAFRFSSPPAPPDTVGAARIINIADERHPYVVSNLRLQVDQPAAHHAADGDPGTLDPAQSYAAHYCNIPSEVNPQIVACSFITSGLRVFNIQDPQHPREVGYFVSPFKDAVTNGGNGSNFAMSKPTFAPERREIWYTDGSSGFYVLRVPKSVWPNPVAAPGQSCLQASGRLAGKHVGPVTLGERRSHLRRVLPTYSLRNRRSWDFYCLTGGGIRAAYRNGRALWALTADRRYSLRGIRPHTSLAAAKRKLHLSRGYKVGLNTWYIAQLPIANGILKVRHGLVEEIGLVNKSLTGTPAQIRRFLRSFN
jgi:LVIVD repeat